MKRVISLLNLQKKPFSFLSLHTKTSFNLFIYIFISYYKVNFLINCFIYILYVFLGIVYYSVNIIIMVYDINLFSRILDQLILQVPNIFSDNLQKRKCFISVVEKRLFSIIVLKINLIK